MTVTFNVPGKVASNNRVTRFGGRGAHKSPVAVSYQQRVFQHAFAAVQAMGWAKPEACMVEIEAYNVRLDVDNVAKNVLDGMNGAMYDDDKRVVRLTIAKYVDHDGERIIVHVSPCEPLVRPKKSRKKVAA